MKYLQKNLVEYKVSVFFCVPLLIESIYKKVMQNVKKQGKEKKVAFGMKLAQQMEHGSILINLSGRGDKDMDYIIEKYGIR